MARMQGIVQQSTDTILLSIISQEPVYGYQIIKELERRSDGLFRLKEGTLYPALHRMERSGLVRGKWQTIAGER